MRRSIVLLVWTIAFLMSFGCDRSSHRAESTHSVGRDGTIRLEGESRSYVRVEPASAPGATANRLLFARVAFDERRLATVGSPVGGRVTSVTVTTGARVNRGDPLLTIHSTDVVAAQAQLAEARAARMLAEQSVARASLLVRQGAGSDAERQQAEAALAQASAQERGASQTLGAMGVGASTTDFVLRAPIAGTVVDRAVQVGSAVGGDQGQALITVADLSTVWVLADVYEHDLAYVHAGDAAHVVVPALDDRRIDGRILYVGEVVDAITRTARARIELANADGALRPGMFAEVEVESPESAVARVPSSAVLARRDEFYVFLDVGQGFRQREVRLGQEDGDHVSVLAGLRPGDRIVTRGAILLDAEANTAF